MPEINVRRLSDASSPGGFRNNRFKNTDNDEFDQIQDNYYPIRNSPVNQSNSSIKSSDNSLSIIKKIKQRKKQGIIVEDEDWG